MFALLFAACSIYPDRDEVWRLAFVRFDDDGDGVLDATEFARYGNRDVPLSAYDTDGDGGVDVAEFEARLESVEPRPLVDSRKLTGMRGSPTPLPAAPRQGRLP